MGLTLARLRATRGFAMSEEPPPSFPPSAASSNEVCCRKSPFALSFFSGCGAFSRSGDGRRGESTDRPSIGPGEEESRCRNLGGEADLEAAAGGDTERATSAGDSDLRSSRCGALAARLGERIFISGSKQ